MNGFDHIQPLTRRPAGMRRLAVLAAAAAAAALCGCARGPAPSVREPLLFPLPPLPPRVQYLGAVSSPKDLPRRRNAFAEFILGPEPIRYPLAKPIAAALSGSRLYICDTTLNTVLMYDLVTGEARPLLGDRGMGKIQQPNNIATDDQGHIYVADKMRGAVLVYGPDEQFMTAWGRPGEIEPVAVAVGSDRLYVADVKNHRIEVWSRTDGAPIRTIGQLGNEPGEFQFPTQLTLDAAGSLYVTDTGNARVQKFSPGGELLAHFGQFGRALGHFAWPKGMDVDGRGRIYVADSRFCNVQIFDPEARLLLFFGGPGPDRGNLDLPAGLKVYPWPGGIPWLEQKLAPGFEPEFLVIVVSQKGEGLINFYAVRADGADEPGASATPDAAAPGDNDQRPAADGATTRNGETK
ncbi:MAG: SBBP repeat-containing protein [Candidatus Sumerlaeia bacterium]